MGEAEVITVDSRVKHWNVNKFGTVTEARLDPKREGYLFLVQWDQPTDLPWSQWYFPSELVEQ